MDKKTLTGILSAAATLGLAAPALADGWYDDHGAYHQELDAEHQLDHQQLQQEHGDYHAGADAEHYWLHATGNDYGPQHWLWHRREARRHRLEHFHEAWEHAQQDAGREAEHDVYHGGNATTWGGTYYVPLHRTWR